MCHQVHDAPWRGDRLQEPGAVEGVKSGHSQIGRVADVVQPGRARQRLVAIFD
jgi:hypothetical protein